MRGAAEFSHDDHQSGLEQAAVIEVLEQGGESAVELGQQAILQPAEVVGVGVVAGVGQHLEAQAGFDPAGGHQALLEEAGLGRGCCQQAGKLSAGGERMAGPEVMRGALMIGFAGAHGAQDGEVMSVPGGQGEMLANPDARDASGDGPEEAPNLAGRVGLHVEGVQVARTAALPNQNARVPGALPTEGAEGADLKEISAG